MDRFAEMVPERVRALAYYSGRPGQQAEAASGLKLIDLGSNRESIWPRSVGDPGHGGSRPPGSSVSGQRHDCAARAPRRTPWRLAQTS